MRWINPFLLNYRVALLERARFCQARGMLMLRLANKDRSDFSVPPLARAIDSQYREAAVHFFRWRRELLAELRALTPRKPR